MQKDLYFDIVSEEGAGALHKLTADGGQVSFHYHYSSSDLESEKVSNTEYTYPSFTEFWKQFLQNPKWFTLHPLYIHPEQRNFIKQQLKNVNWNMVEDEKWQDMYQRQWNKVLNNPPEYYKPLNKGSQSS